MDRPTCPDGKTCTDGIVCAPGQCSRADKGRFAAPDLPALPEPAFTVVDLERADISPACYTADQMLAFRAEAIAAKDAEIARLSAALAAQQPAAVQITDDMARAYLAANTAYWRAVDESVGKPGVWRNGTPHEATLEGLRAALAAAPAVQPSEKERTAILKGVGRINGDGWKDVTRIGEVVYVWNDERPTPYAPGQFPRIGNDCGWTASREQYDFTPATLAEVRECFDALLAQERERVLQGVKGQFEQMLAADRALRLERPAEKEQPAEAVAWLYYERPGRRREHLKLAQTEPPPEGAFPVYAAAPSAQPVAQYGGATVLPDGSAFSTASFPLPKDHWLYAPRGEWDNKRDEYAECPQPILTNAQRGAVRTAARYAIRGATMCGQDQDFDPDALVLNFCYALCGPAHGAVLPADAAAPSAPQTETKGDAA